MSISIASAGTVFMVIFQMCVGSQVGVGSQANVGAQVSIGSQVSLEKVKPVISVQVRATWIWNTTLMITEPEEILAFAKKQKLNLIYLQMDPDIEDASYRSFIQLAAAQGIEIHALAGDPQWVQLTERAQVKAFVQWVKDYNSRVLDNERFRGIHLDVEPYILPAWKNKNKQSEIVELWMNTITLYTEEVKGSGLLSGADIPFWLDDIRTSKVKDSVSLDEWMINKLDQVTIMAYRNMASTNNGIIALSAHEMEVAKKLNKKIIIGVESLPNKEASYVSFHQKGRSVMLAQLRKVEEALLSNTAYLGYAVHDYEGWRKLKE